MWPAGHYVPQTTDAPEDSVNGWMQTESIENEDIVLFLTLAPISAPTPQHAAPASQHASAALICITPSLPSLHGDTSLASIMDASISTPETTFTVGHPPPDVSKDTPVPLSLALYIPGMPATTAVAKSAPTPPPTPPSSHSGSHHHRIGYLCLLLLSRLRHLPLPYRQCSRQGK
ncbi:hypothetical protein BU17DRAFT_97554 [Hysterangium stoloniferum]|nr:hypothetical protein BU17DRAFT_97554 [Hysterangium stoloniferum]